MFLKLLYIEWTRLSRRALFWVGLVLCAVYTGLSLANFYQTNQTELLNGSLKMPGMSFDLANALDQLLILIPLLIIITGNIMGNDYSQRTNQLWLMRAPRQTSLMAKFSILVTISLLFQAITLLIGWAVGFYFKAFIYHVPNTSNLNGLATLAAPFYMTLVNLPYLALTLLLAVGMRSAFLSVTLGLGYTQFLEYLMTGLFHGQSWTKWLMTNLHFSASFLLNSIGNRTTSLPAHILTPLPAMITAVLYTLFLLTLAIWLYRRQDLGG